MRADIVIVRAGELSVAVGIKKLFIALRENISLCGIKRGDPSARARVDN